MDEDKENPHQINSLHLNKVLKAKMFDLHKKRKLQAQQLGLPSPKHKWGVSRLPPEPLSGFQEKLQVEDLVKKIIKQSDEKQAVESRSDTGSAKDSNSFVEDPDCAMSAYSESKFETEVAKSWPPDRPAISASNWGSNTVLNSQCSSDNAAATGGVGMEIVEFGSDLECGLSECGYDSFDPCTDKESDEFLISNEVNPNSYILSSGRWSINQDAQSCTSKPTIDQEFEQYFSTLML